jgi:hypothetical protein
MSIACPYCKAVLTPKGLKPGKYTPKCPKCGNPFLLFVPKDEGGTISVQQLAPKKPADGAEDTVRGVAPNDTVRVPAVKPKNPPPAAGKPGKPAAAPTTDPLPVQSSRPPIKTAPPGANTDVISKGSAAVKPPAARAPQPPAKTPDEIEDAAAALLEGDHPGEAPPPGPQMPGSGAPRPPAPKAEPPPDGPPGAGEP